MTTTEILRIDEADDGERLDRVLINHLPGISRAVGQKLISLKQVKLNGHTPKASDRVHLGDVVEVDATLPPSLLAAPEAVELQVVYQDHHLAVIDKPAGMVVHPSAGHEGGTMVNGLLRLFPGISSGSEYRPGIVHRLDKDTSGLLVVALTSQAHLELTDQIRSRRMSRHYQALVEGNVRAERATIDVPIGRDPASRKRMKASPQAIAAREARTHITVLERMEQFTLVEAKLETGRTHQIRAHMAFIGHPIVGDRLYSGTAKLGLGRQFLHAYKLELDAPVTGERMSFESRLPEDLQTTLERTRSGELLRSQRLP